MCRDYGLGSRVQGYGSGFMDLALGFKASRQVVWATVNITRKPEGHASYARTLVRP